MEEQLGKNDWLHITDTRSGTYKSLACPYTGEVCGLCDTVLVVTRSRRNADDVQLIFSKDGVEALVTDLERVSSQTEMAQLALRSFSESSGEGHTCLSCGQLFDATDDICELQPSLHDTRQRTQQHTVLCHQSCAPSLASDVERFWSYVGLVLD